METDELITINEAADILGVKPGSVYTAIRQDRLTCTILYGRKLLKREDVQNYMQATRPTGEKPKGRPKGSLDRTKRQRRPAGD